MKKIVTLIFIGFSSFCHSQLDKTVHEMTKPSPEVASLGKYGELPINHYTGTANIEVPLHEIDFDGLKIPISLNYSTGGIKVSEESSWVGLGWSLSVEPIITVNIKDLGDLDIEGEQVGYPYTTIPLPEHSYDLTYSGLLWDKLILHEHNYNIINTWDTEPDIFSVALFGETAKFILTQKNSNGGVIKVKLLNEDSRMKIEYIENEKSFIVTNDRGFSFYFNKKEYSVVGSENPMAGDTYIIYQGFENPQITGWKIEKIVSPKGNSLYYEYNPTATIKDQPVVSEKKHMVTCPNLENFTRWNEYANNGPTRTSNMNFHASLYLKRIYCTDYRIDFLGSDRSDLLDGYDTNYLMTSVAGFQDGHAQKLDKITIKDFLLREIKDIQISYSYFNGANAYNANQSKQYLRLKLDAVFINNDFFRGFDYINPNSMPWKRSTSVDYWGYYNGKNNIHRYPSYKAKKICSLSDTNNLVRIFGANLLPDFNFGKNGLLDKIIYPTKGYTIIYYEPHTIMLNDGTKNMNVPFEDFEVYSATSYDESSPADSEIFTLNGNEADHAFIEKINPDYSVSIPSLFGHIVLEIGCGSGFNNTHISSSYRKCEVLPTDVAKIALELINADSGQVVKKSNFSTGNDCYPCTPVAITNGIFEKNILLSGLPAGRYFMRVRALKHISNLLDLEEGIYPGTPDYMKQYYFPVRVRATIPKSAIYSNYNKEIGGSRINEIKNYDQNGAFLTGKKYKYESKLESSSQMYSSGILINELDYGNEYSYGTNDFNCNGGSACASVCKVRTLTVYSENRRLQLSPPQNHIGYRRVEEISIGNLAGESVGKTIYHFSVDKNENVSYFNNPAFTFYRPVQNPADFGTSIDIENLALAPRKAYEESNGDLLKTEYFDKMGNLKYTEESTYYYHHLYFPRKIDIGMHIKFGLTYSFNCENVPTISGTMQNMQIYNIKNETTPLQKKTITEYLSGGNVETTVQYSYNGKYLPSTIETSTSDGTQSIIKNFYPGDQEVSGLANSPALLSKNIIGSPLVSKKFSGTELLDQTEKEYSLFNGNALLAESKMKSAKAGGVMEDLFEYQQYDFRGNVTQYKKASGAPVSIIWGYKSGLPVAKLENIAYADIPAGLITAIQQATDALNSTEAQVFAALDALRNSSDANMKKAMITTYTYRPLIGMSTLTDPKGYRTAYEYDTFGRLEFVKDHQGNIVTHNQYHYKL